MLSANPLQKYYRQPKLYISLPSKGMYYPPGSLKSDPNNIPVYAMTGFDEIMLKTPDALFNGEATIKVIESCCPAIASAKLIPSIDIDTILIAIRSATYGNELPITHVCSNCNNEEEYDINLSNLIQYFTSQQFSANIQINDEISIIMQPVPYSISNALNMQQYKLQKTLANIAAIEDTEEQNTQLEAVYSSFSDLQISTLLANIESVVTPDGTVSDKEFIEEWLRNSDKDAYSLIRKKLESNVDVWTIPKQQVECSECHHCDDLAVTLDQSSFFG